MAKRNSRRRQMRAKKDGRQYQRVTRRGVIILTAAYDAKKIDEGALAELLEAGKYAEFQHGPEGKYVQASRIREYVRFFRRLGCLSETESGVAFALPSMPKTEEQWAQALGDRAAAFLARVSERQPGQIRGALENIRKSLLAKHQIPTVGRMLEALLPKSQSTVSREAGKWALFLYADRPNSELLLRRYPALIPADQEK